MSKKVKKGKSKPAGGAKEPKKKPSDFFGILTKEEGEKFEKHITKARGEW